MDSSLRDRLETLRTELENIVTVDDAERQRLGRLIEDIRKVLDAPVEGHQPEISALGGGLRAAATRLETSYPEAALVMGQVIDALANLGL